MKLIDTKDAVGHILCHDITQIVKGVTKQARFRKGHVVTEEDIPVLLSLGKDHLYIWEKQEGMLHENEAAQILYDICRNDYMKPSEVKEGKIELIAECDGVFKVDVARLDEINSLDEIMIATRHNNFPVKAGDKLAGTRVIPLVIDEKKLHAAQKIAGDKPLLSLLPYRHKKVGIVTTGNEVYYGRIKDTFGPVIMQKLSEYDVTLLGQKLSDDNPENITARIREFLDEGADMVVCTGGMSVDPDDKTPAAIKATGAEIVSYGAPVLPGAMFLLSYYNGNIPILGLPGCVMYAKRTIFDLVLPRIMADERLSKKDLAVLGHGGLCLNCEVCHYPYCSFGKA
ncbi:molybdenum cofactor synthesis domain-containing protein [Hydrogenoanaerobacterium saccharovorans]|uniref:Molybdopterin molybdenumtransferase n=1 Tax=Hydrogenoanaerobacterium saccharovorans TaxID=474960 RepID=A0A1H7YYW6_9FIRM|nr:molybdopterin-binding protein [Hydrogenoanaerobacterium saccharovorans]RPF48919.1 molybdenum cofactor synthesis domain-containing protein [Hydrogenoanaerobacterium saccharovorans]SEM51360.1 molybdenum cofactor synthesis domain-containing protein [Hydrogenoanaerobacterium saccharovorans]